MCRTKRRATEMPRRFLARCSLAKSVSYVSISKALRQRQERRGSSELQLAAAQLAEVAGQPEPPHLEAEARASAGERKGDARAQVAAERMVVFLDFAGYGNEQHESALLRLHRREI